MDPAISIDNLIVQLGISPIIYTAGRA